MRFIKNKDLQIISLATNFNVFEKKKKLNVEKRIRYYSLSEALLSVLFIEFIFGTCKNFSRPLNHKKINSNTFVVQKYHYKVSCDNYKGFFSS